MENSVYHMLLLLLLHITPAVPRMYNPGRWGSCMVSTDPWGRLTFQPMRRKPLRGEKGERNHLLIETMCRSYASALHT